MSVFTLSPIVLPKCESSWREGFVLCPGPKLSSFCSLPSDPCTLPNLCSCLPTPPWVSPCVQRGQQPRHMFCVTHTLPLSPFCCHLFCFEGAEVQRRPWVDALPLSFRTGSRHRFCVEVKSPWRMSFCPLTVAGDALVFPGLLQIPDSAVFNPVHSQLLCSFFLMRVSQASVILRTTFPMFSMSSDIICMNSVFDVLVIFTCILK